jgi:tetratricopeptide (TPR) repeat protein
MNNRFYLISADGRLAMMLVVSVMIGFSCGMLGLPPALVMLLVVPSVSMLLYPEIIALGAIIASSNMQIAAALGLCRHGLLLSPNNQALLLTQAMAYYRSKRFEEAELAITRALEAKPSAIGYINRAGVRCNLSKFEEAEKDVNKAILIEPRQYLAFQNRAVARFGMQNYEGCLEDCRYLQKLGKNPPVVRLLINESYLWTGRLSQVEAETTPMIGKVKAGSIEALSLALLLYYRNQFIECLEICAQVSDAEPYACQFVHCQGFAYWALSEGELALQSATRAIMLNPLAENGHLLRAYVYADAGLTDQALMEIWSEPVVKSRLSIARDGEAYVHWRRGEWHEMLTAATTAVERCPTFAFSQALLSLALAGVGRIDEALEVAQKATKLQPLESFGWYSLANAYWQKEQIDEALKSLTTAIEANPHDRWSYGMRADLYKQVGDQVKAEKDRAHYTELQSKLMANINPDRRPALLPELHP